MDNEPSICVVCAWRKDCRKRFMKGGDVTLRCPDFTKDLAIKETESDDKEEDSGNNKGRL